MTANYTSLAGATSFAVKDLTPNTTYHFVVPQDEPANASTNTQEKSGMALDADVLVRWTVALHQLRGLSFRRISVGNA